MVQAIKQTVTIQPGGRIEVLSSEFPVGAQVEVIVLVDRDMPLKRYSDLIGSGRGTFATPSDADAFLGQERDAWSH
jgi:hypothetical protein